MEEILGSIYCNNSEKFGTKLMKDVFKTLKAEKHDLGVAMKEKKIGNLYGFSGGNYAGNVYEKNNLCPTINTCQGGGKQPMIIDNPKQLGFMDSGTGKHQSNTVYDEKGICPNITTIEGGGTQQIKIATADAIRKDNTTNVQKDNLLMETVKIKQATKQGYIECEVGGVADLSYPNSKTRRGRVQDRGNICPTLTAQNQDICKIGQISSDKSQYGTVISDDGLSSTLQAGTHGYANNCIATQYRIRKLTPRECWRLMNFKDSDFEKAQEVNSNTQLYKQAGNSIVKNVLVAIFGQMIDGKENVYKEVV